MDKQIAIGQIFNNYSEIVAVYLFGSFNENPKHARDIDLAVLTKNGSLKPVNLYMELYPSLVKIFSPLDVDLLFLQNAPLAIAFEIISQGKVIYSSDEDMRTDYEFLISGRYMDFKYHLERGYNELYENLKEELGV
ncbi:type VII toxin-antitoxin system MntA family adenylyltransferase antitoxin [Desulfotomaculum sp. 1211_IL3151]|uniref:type VII toxin-antitoxin system MntA family adenylyltransferase antitoxin n=1 Tax=Desulfotomaculum sp. 1211_IL3151 TaxID=3084055 RepID=UPI002FDAD80D